MVETAAARTSLIEAQADLDDEMCTWPEVPTLHTRANAVDQWPQPITPLTQDLIMLPQERGLALAFSRDLGTAPSGPPWTWNGVFYGWVTYGVEPAAAMADNLPGYSRADVYADYFGVSEDPDAPARTAKGAGPLAVAGVGARFVRTMLTYPRRATRMTEQARAQLDSDLARDWPAVSDAELCRRLSAHGAQAAEVRTPHVEASVISAPLFQTVSDLVRKAAPDEADALVTQALSGIGGVHLREATTAMAAVAAGTLDRERFLADYGFRGANEFELAARPWRDDPVTLDRRIAAAAHESGVVAGQRRDEARARLAELAGRRWVVWSRLLRLLETHMRWRENGKVPMAMATHSIRLVVREAGRRLVERGRLDQADDVFFLRLAELTAELTAELQPAAAGTGDLRPAVTRRRRTHALASALDLPEMLDVTPGRLEVIGPQRWRSMGVLPPATAPAAAPDELHGVGAAAGIATGRARIVHDPDAVDLDDGDVIVARGTDSSWTPLFFAATAVIVDVGGAMSHPAIAAREVGIPCVINVKTGTTRIREGQQVTVDGTTGVVRLH